MSATTLVLGDTRLDATSIERRVAELAAEIAAATQLPSCASISPGRPAPCDW